MTAVVVVGVFVGGASRMALMSKCLSDQSRSHYQAANLAKNRLERARTLPFDQLALCEEDGIGVNASGAGEANAPFRRSTTVTPLGSDVVEVRVTIELRDRVTLRFEGEKEDIGTCIARFRSPTA
jgi:hypothetical protein